MKSRDPFCRWPAPGLEDFRPTQLRSAQTKPFIRYFPRVCVALIISVPQRRGWDSFGHKGQFRGRYAVGGRGAVVSLHDRTLTRAVRTIPCRAVYSLLPADLCSGNDFAATAERIGYFRHHKQLRGCYAVGGRRSSGFTHDRTLKRSAPYRVEPYIRTALKRASSRFQNLQNLYRFTSTVQYHSSAPFTLSRELEANPSFPNSIR